MRVELKHVSIERECADDDEEEMRHIPAILQECEP
jgi:hypothetical protein